MQSDRRFWSKVDKTGDCWLWTAATSSGYGVFTMPDSSGRWRNVYAHRHSWLLHNGAIPDGLWVLHTCDNPPCIRPDHLRLGTRLENLADMRAKGRGYIPAARPKGLWHGLVPARSGENNPRARLTWENVHAIRQRTIDGARQIDLAREYGVDRSHIHQIVLGRKWVEH